MLTVHHLGISQSERIIWLCEELEIPYRSVRYERDPVTGLAPAEYKALSPFGTAPVIVDGNVVMGESGAIVEYVIAKHGNGRLAVPADSPDFANYLYWFHFANGTIMPSLSANRIISRMGGVKDNALLQSMFARASRAHDVVEQRLGEVDYFAGSAFTAADIMMFFPLTTMRAYARRDLSPYPNIRSYLKRIGSRATYQRAMETADPGMDRTAYLA